MTPLPRLSGIEEVVALAKKQVKVANELGVSKTTIKSWLDKGYVPLEYVQPISQRYGIERARLCEPLILEVFPEILGKGDSEE